MVRDWKWHYFQQDKAFLESIVTMDESWVRCYSHETKEQSKIWSKKGRKPPVEAKTTNRTKKLLYVVFVDSESPIYQHFMPCGCQTINSRYHKEILTTFLCYLRRKRPVRNAREGFLHYDSTKLHVSHKTKAIIEEKGIEMIPCVPDLPDLASCDFDLFPKSKKLLAGEHHTDDMDLIKSVEASVRRLAKNGFMYAHKDWMRRMDLCLREKGYYVEKH